MKHSQLASLIFLAIASTTLVGCGSGSGSGNDQQQDQNPGNGGDSNDDNSGGDYGDNNDQGDNNDNGSDDNNGGDNNDNSNDDNSDDQTTVDFPSQFDQPQIIKIDGKGSILAANSGLTLYTFKNDSDGTATCNGVDGDAADSTTDASSCAGVWPPLLADDGATATGYFSIITRDSGAKQWAYQGMPLYQFTSDSAQGDTLGDGLQDVWYVARPKPVKKMDVNDVLTYVGNQTIYSVTSTAQVLEGFRADKDGFSLYIFDNDAVDSSACYTLNGDGCINAWPPLLADKGAKAKYPLSVLELDNGKSQWAYKGKALYFYVGDTAAGQTTGDGVGNSWHLADLVPAKQRGDDTSTRLTATGKVMALLPDSDNNPVATEVNKDQFTLYTFDNDTAGVSNCSGACVTTWPPFLAKEADVENGNFTKIDRGDGNMQWAWKQKPLYFFSGDTEASESNGDGVGGTWHIISPQAQQPVAAETELVSSSTDLGSVVIANTEVSILQGGEAVTVDKTGFQLYTFDNDDTEVSNCTSTACMGAWPALLAKDEDVAQAPFSIFTRADGFKQWAINGKPLYFFSSDTAAGQQTGEGVGNVWWAASPAPVRMFEHSTENTIAVASVDVLPSEGQSSDRLENLTLYTFDEDTANSGVSTCFTGCAPTWPPLLAKDTDEGFGDYTIIDRTADSTRQWAYKGLPLYFFIGDQNIGDTNGNYTGWPIAKP